MNPKTILAAWCAGAVFLAVTNPLLAEAPRVFALQDAKVVPVSGPAIEHGTVVIRDGVIEAVGAGVKPPADAWVIDAKGLTVYPGLVDALSTWGVPGLAATPRPATGRAAAPVPSAPAPPPARGPEDRPSNTSYLRIADQILVTDKSIETAREGGFTTAVTFPNASIFSGQGAAFDLAGERAGAMILNPAAGQYITLRSAGYSSFPGSLMGVIAYIRQIYLDADHYKAVQGIYAAHPQGLARPAYDRTLEGVLESPRVLLPAQRAVEVARMVALVKELKLHAVLYGGAEAAKSAATLKASGIPVLVSLKYPVRDREADPAEQDSMRVLEMRDLAPGTPAELARSGVTFAFYSDGLSPNEMMRAAQKAIARGLSRDAALRAMTLDAARIYGLDDRIGSVDPGKIANLVVADGDLFTDKTQIKYVFVDGNKFEPAAPVTAPEQKKDAPAESNQ